MEGLNQENAGRIPLPVDIEVHPEAQIPNQMPNANVGANPPGLIDVATLRQVIQAMNLGGSRNTNKANISCPTFSRKEGEDYTLFEGQFLAYKRNQSLNDEQAKLHLFSAFKEKAAMIVRIARPGTEVFEANQFEVYSERIRALFVSRAQSDVARNNFENRVQEGAEEIQIYAALKMSLYQLAYGAMADDSHLVREFIRGIKNPKIMKKVVHNRPENYEQAVASAMEAEAAEKYIDNLLKNKGTHSSIPPPKVIAPTPPISREEPMELNEINKRLAALERRGRNRDQYGRYLSSNNDRGDGCWKCGDPNHFQRNCPKWQQGFRGSRGGRGNRSRGRSNRGFGNRGNYRNNNNRVASLDEANDEEQERERAELAHDEHSEEDFQ